MHLKKLRDRLISANIIFSMVMMGFMGLIVVEDVDVEGAIIIVDCNGGGSFTTIQGAVNAANIGDTIRVWDGTYYENVLIDKSVELRGNGTGNTILDGGGTGDVVRITSGGVVINYFTITNSGQALYSTDAGIQLDSVSNTHIKYNDCSGNSIGILLNYSDANYIRNNTCNDNLIDGIQLIYESAINHIKNNTCVNNGLAGINLSQSDANWIFNNILSDQEYGIRLDESDFNIIDSNTCFNHSHWGIALGHDLLYPGYCNYNEVFNNFCYDNHGGICTYLSDDNEIRENDCYSSYHGIYIAESDRCNINTNLCDSNILYGIWLDCGSNFNEVLMNVCTNNDIGIYIQVSNSNNVRWNTCTENRHGIYLFSSSTTTIRNNTCTYNDQSGLFLKSSSDNYILLNQLNNNLAIGITIDHDSDSNLVYENNFNLNSKGVSIQSSSLNSIYDNNISENSVKVFESNSVSSSNEIYHNIIISDPSVVTDEGTNAWNNDLNEGNYWSDYNGLDNGANGRVAKDGIGDTDLAHHGLDNYPFMEPFGWLYPGTPILLDPGYVDPDGSYVLNWNATNRVTGYILEECENALFDVPTVLYDGSGTAKSVSNPYEGTYYYRVRAYNDDHQSDWSNIENMIVEFGPIVPMRFQVFSWPKGNALNITWDKNTDKTVSYDLRFRTKGDWTDLDNITHPGHTFNHSGLIDGKQYEYQIRARDNYNLTSGYSGSEYGTPNDITPPAKPEGLFVLSKNSSSVKLNWTPSTEEDLVG